MEVWTVLFFGEMDENGFLCGDHEQHFALIWKLGTEMESVDGIITPSALFGSMLFRHQF